VFWGRFGGEICLFNVSHGGTGSTEDTGVWGKSVIMSVLFSR